METSLCFFAPAPDGSPTYPTPSTGAARPQSASLYTPSRTSTLSGFTSRCATFRACANASADATWRSTFSISFWPNVFVFVFVFAPSPRGSSGTSPADVSASMDSRARDATHAANAALSVVSHSSSWMYRWSYSIQHPK